MNFEWTPTQYACSFAGANIPNGYNTKLDSIDFVNGNQEKPIKLKGNRCGHNKNKIKVSPVFRKNKLRRRRPHSIEEFGRRLSYLACRLRTGVSGRDNEGNQDSTSGALSWYFSLYESDRFGRFLYHIYHDKKARRRRSERVEAALFLVLATLVSGCNLHEMAYGYHDESNRFHYFDYTKLGKDSMVSEPRTKRAMKLLKEMELVTVTPHFKTLPNGKVITEYTKIELNEEIFAIFGLQDEYLKDRERSTQKFYKKQDRLDHSKARRSFYSQKRTFSKKSTKPRKIGDMMSSSPKDIRTIAKTLVRPPMPLSDTHGRDVLERIKKLTSQGMSISDAMAAIKQQYPPPKHN